MSQRSSCKIVDQPAVFVMHRTRNGIGSLIGKREERMNSIRKVIVILSAITFCLSLAVVSSIGQGRHGWGRHDNGRHLGWYKHDRGWGNNSGYYSRSYRPASYGYRSYTPSYGYYNSGYRNHSSWRYRRGMERHRWWRHHRHHRGYGYYQNY